MFAPLIYPAVVNVQDTGLVIALPSKPCAPLTVAVYVVAPASAALGVKVAVSVEALYETVAGTLVPLGSVSVKLIVPLWTGSLKVAVMFGLVTETPVAPAAGVMP